MPSEDNTQAAPCSPEFPQDTRQTSAPAQVELSTLPNCMVYVYVECHSARNGIFRPSQCTTPAGSSTNVIIENIKLSVLEQLLQKQSRFNRHQHKLVYDPYRVSRGELVIEIWTNKSLLAAVTNMQPGQVIFYILPCEAGNNQRAHSRPSTHSIPSSTQRLPGQTMIAGPDLRKRHHIPDNTTENAATRRRRLLSTRDVSDKAGRQFREFGLSTNVSEQGGHKSNAREDRGRPRPSSDFRTKSNTNTLARVDSPRGRTSM
ncbi:hypothetical protein BDV19DRAFT_48569 [Aspergillus venezuelensis]